LISASPGTALCAAASRRPAEALAVMDWLDLGHRSAAERREFNRPACRSQSG